MATKGKEKPIKKATRKWNEIEIKRNEKVVTKKRKKCKKNSA